MNVDGGVLGSSLFIGDGIKGGVIVGCTPEAEADADAEVVTAVAAGVGEEER